MASVGLYYMVGFSTAGSNQSMTFTNGATPGTIASGTYAHQTMAALPAVSGFTALSPAVVTALNAAVAGTYTCTLTLVAGSPGLTYTIYSAAGFTLSFPATAAGARTKAALGFTSNTPSGAGTIGSPYVSNCRPIYYMAPDITARTNFSDLYEPDEIVSEAVSDGGTPYAVARQTTELWCDWTQSMEPKASTLTYAATTTLPWTWQALVKHARGQYPIAVYESAISAQRVYKLRAEGASFRPERVATDYDGLWNIPFRMRDLGTL